MSDVRMWREGGFGNCLEPWERGLGDKGYQGGEMLVPPYKLKDKDTQLSEEEEAANALIATVRIHIGRWADSKMRPVSLRNSTATSTSIETYFASKDKRITLQLSSLHA